MREAAFIKQNSEKWKSFENLLGERFTGDPDKLSELFIELTDDLSYAQTNYPSSKITIYLNDLTLRVHGNIYKNKKERSGRFFTFWKTELPLTIYKNRNALLASLVIFSISIAIGVISAYYDDSFVRIILGDSYVNMTISNIERGDPMAVYKGEGETSMFLFITFNNIKVALMTFAAGVAYALGTVYFLFTNGIMLGSFQTFFYKYDLLLHSVLSIWIHGTIEISSIVIAGGAGLVLGNSLLFPGTYSRGESLLRGAREGAKISIGLIPLFIIAGFLEGFVTRHTEMHDLIKLFIILASAAFIIYYFIFYPIIINNQFKHATKN
ncbi:membrane protein [Sporocytophaga myxococcoides]|uniref:Membrane protein n=1 Tax=Sporocytophaga myxococcoides TaxID=153721 RepID=A0A098LJY4_9BACT|nr:stage II sporulation protein M [Sporocytophaga myxococcoides]GAL87235.1 membrane protein [Sporocytophaga myxococcoides]